VTLYSPLEDFVQRTLVCYPSTWQRLEYIASLRGEDSRYEHWGLSRRFGDEAAQNAMQHAHRDLMLRLLRTPLQTLMEEASGAAEQQNLPFGTYVQHLQDKVEQLLPVHLGGGSVRHFSSVLVALSALATCRPAQVATLQVS
jgi:hypothetical protein